MTAMKTRFRICHEIMALIVALQPALYAQGKPQLSVEIAVESVPAAQQALGITKLYNIILVNKSDATLFVNQCESTDDTRHTALVTPIALQRWNPEAKRWDTIVAHSPDYCRSDRFHQARLIRTAVAPGQKLTANGDFVGARDPFSFGDRGRFVVFLRAPGDDGDIAISPEFQIDEHRNKPTKATQ
jgi:hypothetical protein